MSMEWVKAPQEMIDRFDAMLPKRPEIERRKMFGYPNALVNGNMFCGLFADSMFVRLAEEQRHLLLAVEGAHMLEPMPGRAMREYVVVPASILHDDTQLRSWMDHAFEFALALPPKERKPRGKKKAKSS